jgi:hypothetical protein
VHGEELHEKSADRDTEENKRPFALSTALTPQESEM